MNGNFDWVKFYTDFADKLYEYKDNRNSLVQILNNAFNDKDKENFNKILDKNDIDPFTIFASFNSFSGENRVTYIKRFIEAFKMEEPIISNSFDGVPSAQPLQKRYYDHDGNDILTEVQNLWDLFVNSINYANDKTDQTKQLFCESFDIVKNMRGIRLSKLTAALFWIRPNYFMTLDANSYDFLKKEYGIVNRDNIDGKDYLKILEECNNICKNENTHFNNFPELSHFAYYYARKNEYKIWKISHGDLNETEIQEALEKQVILVGWGDDNKQGRDFSRTMKIGDWFYLTLGGGSGIKLLGKIVSDAENSQIKEGWRERKYQLVRYALNSTPYPTEHKKKWEPTGQSTCFEVKEENFELFEIRILKPYFDMSLSDLIESHTNNRKDENHMNKNIPKINLNTILYGPPGTGKTYNTVLYAVAICDPKKSLEELEEQAKKEGGYEEILNTYNALLEQGRIAFTTFHQSYGYEDFIEGIKPIVDENDSNQDITYDVKPGIFKSFCEETTKQMSDLEAFDSIWEKFIKDVEKNNNEVEISLKTKTRKLVWEEVEERFYVGDYNWKGCFVYKESVRKFYFDGVVEGSGGTKRNRQASCQGIIDKLKKEYGLSALPENVIAQNKVFIIDEINRGNVSKIFGELITLIEEEKRGKSKVKLPYSQSEFTVPENVYILGTMNTADRSLVLMDTALRRRFDFVEMMPDASIFEGIEVDGVSIESLLKKINKRIEFLYDREHTVGHAYFKELLDKENRNIETLRKIFIKKIIPLLQEYFYDDYNRIRLVLGDNQFNDNMCFIKENEEMVDVFFGNPDIDMDAKTYTVNEDIDKFGADRFRQIYEASVKGE